MTNRTIKFGPNPVTLAGNALIIGKQAPNFSAIDGTLKEVTLSDFKGKVKLFSIFPSIDTGVCSMQTKKFNDKAAAFGEQVAFISISADLPFALKRFCGAEGITNLTPLSDHKKVDFGSNYGFLINELRLLARGVVVVDKEDVIRYVEIVPEVGSEPNYDAAISAVRQLV
jgi:thioredoxin-dependent peroxiredoxin